MIHLVQKYNKYVQSIPDLISQTDYKANYFIKLLNLKAPTYYRKLRDNAFTSDEILMLTKALFPKELLLMELEQSQADKESGRVVEHSEAMNFLRKKHL